MLDEDGTPPRLIDEGDAAFTQWGLEALCFSGDADHVTLPNPGVLLITGPNAAGKSRALQELVTTPGAGLVLSDARWVLPQDLGSWAAEAFPTIRVGDRGLLDLGYGPEGGETVIDPRNMDPSYVKLLRLPASARLVLTDSSREESVATGVARHEHLLDEVLSPLIRELFGADLVLDVSGSRLRLGDDPPRPQEFHRIWPDDYVNAVQAVPALEEAGDGIRSFVGALLALRLSRALVFAIDEPEVFLHPPQARRLGREIAQVTVERQRQAVVVTHSPDVIAGCMAATTRVSVCRLVRDGNVNRATALQSGDLQKLWSAPLLRSANATLGLFHRGVLIVEGDKDARVYEAVLDAMSDRGRFAMSPDVFVVHGGGKGQLRHLAASYTRLDVPVAVVADIDLLRSEEQVQQVLQALGSDLSERERGDLHAARQALKGLDDEHAREQAADDLRRAADRLQRGAQLSTTQRNKLTKVLDDATTWSQAKRTGISDLRGPTLNRTKTLLDGWQDRGLFIVRTGELESLRPESRVDAWTEDTIQAIADGEILEEAERLLQGAVDYLLQQTSRGGVEEPPR